MAAKRWNLNSLRFLGRIVTSQSNGIMIIMESLFLCLNYKANNRMEILIPFQMYSHQIEHVH